MAKRPPDPKSKADRWPFSALRGMPIDAVFTPRDTAHLIGLEERQLWTLVRTGQFDPPIERLPGHPGFRSSSITRWLDARPVHKPMRTGDGTPGERS